MTLSAQEVNRLKQAPAIDGVLPEILQRWSPRAFADREVSDGELTQIFEAVRWAASSSNEQPWRYLLGRHGTVTHEKIFDALVGGNKSWAGQAPVLLLGVASGTFARGGGVNGYALHDLGAADATLALQATHMGLAAHFMGGYDHAAARAAFEIPADYAMGAVVALGYLGEPALLGDEKLMEREVAPRTRKGLAEIVFTSWGEAAGLG